MAVDKSGKIVKEKRPPVLVRLQKAVEAWDVYIKPMLQCRNRMLKSYANAWYDGGKGGSLQPLNLYDRGTSILLSLLVSNDPKALVLAEKKGSNPNARIFAETLELMLNDLCGEIKLAAYTLRPVVFAAFYGMGIAKTGIMHSHTVELGGFLHDYGQAYCDFIDMPDYIGDKNARNRQEVKIEGHRYRLPIQYVAESGLFKNYDKLKTNLRLYGQDTLSEEISKGNSINKSEEEIYPTVELIDLWLPDSNMIVTIPPTGQGTKYLREVEWDGPETGPFDVLSFKYFPETIVPIPPVYLWLSLNKTINIIVNKMREMCEREKTIAVGDLVNPQDKQLVKDSGHGDFILLQGGADTVKEVTFGGFNAQSFPFLQFLLNQYSLSGPNLELTGGKGTMAGTLGQEQMMQANAFREIDDMISLVYQFTQSIMKKLAHFLITDPLKTKKFPRELLGIPYELEYHSSRAEGILDDYRIEIEPYSLSRMNPEMRYQRVLQLLSQIVIPLAPLAAQQGSYPMVDAIVEELGEYLNIDTSKWWKSLVPSQSVGMGPYQPAQGTVLPKSGQDNRFELGQAEASKQANLQQYMTRTGGGTKSTGEK